ncbi:13236_t:CDS:2 [Ambispora leptoticha]|uniref:Biogenesis of lysosome-related organelles complex 1 subunit 7 n=1 Tax=Ambispora leptoticha TaxID=144679 RepID=A0A9N9FMD1_9GLOM|nr:13236_t:CDS:2 [Ambispora leptoticha]
MTESSPKVDFNDEVNELKKEKFARGILDLLTPIVQEMDSRIVAVKSSQTELNKEIERLLAELQLFNEAAEVPPIQSSLQKLINARKRLAATNQTLKIVYDRVERIYNQLNKGTGSNII